MEKNDNEEKNEISLLDIKRKAQNDQEAQNDNSKQKKFKILNYTSKDSSINKLETEFIVYFCFLCGNNCLISEININKLPIRKVDNSIIFPTLKFINKKFHKTQNKKILIKRQNGIEIQYRILCNECEAPIGYTTSLNNDEQYLYYYDYSLVTDPMKSKLFLDL
ncbi:conserved Plasmodium protein, unknown function [Plasmodium berghei]|uniref:STEEP1 domain-containing protein n=2 Tax=Plasmodium berghei TaxID=5821 RepID=A0A509ASY5_PLABA|nr:conserved protein, unknown function [Plasmodium berghei ANKA]CXJ28721.1 conserved Plasmodium protein, unknown function [Plasmodium berghei]SCM27057.1 conserved Plasmodium protein, unknown function [Plasmodium berghei]SCN28783.1 conserved Plasmodium protein, unknown function [Plasmodium berghei]SCO63066.1 conserved Plasmodium protein, unknown function [Plasmodium berghei]SCO64530.1 conserved Plasmodium protein, unknown function [Plasmodium berghei]|eukprot:XP_034424429.1 conserved protein, unknown function [Plasmodium berghei ANKA]